MAKNIMEVMKKNVCELLEGENLDLLGIANGTTTNEETGEISHFVRAEVEVPRGVEKLSRCRFSVKIPNATATISEEMLENSEYSIVFENLSISYIDARGTVYFKADAYEICKEE